MRIVDHPGFSAHDFAERWRKARVAALSAVLREHGGVDVDATERDLVARVPVDGRDQALRRVFDHSRALGLSAARAWGVSLELDDFSEVLPLTGAACFSGAWRKHNSARVLERAGCGFGARNAGGSGAFGCDYWREALDGLVMGLGDSERLARHKSVGHGDGECLDILYTENAPVPRVVSGSGSPEAPRGPKFAPVPEDLVSALEGLRARMAESGVKLRWDGVAEGVLYYRMETPQGGMPCGSGGKLLHDSVARAVAERRPGMTARDGAPVAVFGSPAEGGGK